MHQRRLRLYQTSLPFGRLGMPAQQNSEPQTASSGWPPDSNEGQMAFVTLLEAHEAASQAVAASQMTVEAQLRVASDAPLGQFDIFLSHSSMDKELVLGVKACDEGYGCDTSPSNDKFAQSVLCSHKQCISLEMVPMGAWVLRRVTNRRTRVRNASDRKQQDVLQ